MWFHASLVNLHTLLKCPFLWLLRFDFFPDKNGGDSARKALRVDGMGCSVQNFSAVVGVSVVSEPGALFEASRCLLLLTNVD